MIFSLTVSLSFFSSLENCNEEFIIVPMLTLPLPAKKKKKTSWEYEDGIPLPRHSSGGIQLSMKLQGDSSENKQ